MNKAKQENLVQKIMYLGAIAASTFVFFFVITSSWIGYDVKSHCQSAQLQYEGDCVDALIQVLDDKHQSFRTRNSAIWALGQLGNSKALPILESYYTGSIPDRESLDSTISQYELKKAIKLVGGGFNLTAIVWRHSSIN